MTKTKESPHKVASNGEWLKQRKELLKEEKELTRRSDELARKRQALPWVQIEKEYQFETDQGTASLADLFRGRSQLLVYHFAMPAARYFRGVFNSITLYCFENANQLN